MKFPPPMPMPTRTPTTVLIHGPDRGRRGPYARQSVEYLDITLTAAPFLGGGGVKRPLPLPPAVESRGLRQPVCLGGKR